MYVCLLPSHLSIAFIALATPSPLLLLFCSLVYYYKSSGKYFCSGCDWMIKPALLGMCKKDWYNAAFGTPLTALSSSY